MANLPPTQLDTSNTSTKKGSTGESIFSSTLNLDNFYNSQYLAKNPDTFKSLDFSDIAIYGAKNSRTAKDEKFRHFHQMRLFIDASTQHHRSNYTGKTVITSNLPERVQYALNSKWEQPLNFGDALFNLAMQTLGRAAMGGDGPASGTLRASSFKVWTNTEPLSLNLTIPVIDDGEDVSRTNLVEALEILGSLVLPSHGEGDLFYTPPPSPLDLQIHYTKINPDKAKRGADTFHLDTKNHARIMLQLGGILLIDNCVIEQVNVEYPNTKAQIMHKYTQENFGMTGGRYLHPLLAIVTLKISTLEALTANTYSRMLWARPQPGQGRLESNISGLTNAVNNILDKFTPDTETTTTEIEQPK
jgi:hypothetical protein